MGITKIIINGVEYIIEDLKALALLELLSESLIKVEDSLKELRDKIGTIEDSLKWNDC